MLNRISLRQMEYFVATAECGSIISASERIHVSSPSISAAVSHIESELHVQLFVRHHAKGLTLTPIGTQVMVECKRILEQMGSLYTIASESANSIRGPLRVGCLPALAPMISPEVVYGFSQVFPAVRVTQIVANQETLMEKLRTMEIDIALTYDLYTKEDVAFESLAQLPPHVMVGEFHPLAQKSAVTLEELAEYPMIMLDVPESNAYFMSLFLNQELQPHIAARSADFDVVRAMVANHMGYALCNVRPKSNQSLDGRRLVRIRLAGQHRPMRLGMATYKAINTSRLLNAFIQRCRAYVSDHYIPGMSAPRYCDPRMISPEKTESTEDKVLAA